MSIKRIAVISVFVLAIGGGIAVMINVRAPSAEPVSAPTNENVQIPSPDTGVMQPRVAALLDDARNALVVAPGSGSAWGNFGAVLDAHNLYGPAVTCYRQAHRLKPAEFRWVYLLGVAEELSGGSADAVIEQFTRSTQLSPGFPPAHLRLGDALMRQGRYVAAVTSLERAVQLDPSLAIAHRSLGQTLLAIDQPARALEHLAAANAAPGGQDDGPLQATLARAYHRLGRVDEAQAAMERSRTLGPVLNVPDPIRFEISKMGTSSEHCWERAVNLMSRARYDEALRQLQIVNESVFDDADVHYRTGICHARTGSRQPAIEHLLRAVQLNEALPTAHVALSVLLQGAGRLPEAIHHARRAVHFRPKVVAYRIRLASMLIGAHGVEEAVAILRDLDPGDLTADAHYTWGQALEALGDISGAAEHYTMAVSLESTHRAAARLEALGG